MSSRFASVRASRLALLSLVAASLALGACGRTDMDMFGDAEVPLPDAGADFGTDAGTDAGLCVADLDCDDGLYCNGQEVCSDGACVPGTAPVCADMVDCTVDTCVESTDSCQSLPDSALCADGEACNAMTGCTPSTGCRSSEECQDGFVCNGAEQCVGGLCVAGPLPLCGDPFDCTTDSCVESAGGCVSTPVDSLCDDRLFCTGTETCSVMAGCLPGVALVCNDGVACTLDSCSEARRTCVTTPRDADMDGAGDALCGGTDCDDANPWCARASPSRATTASTTTATR